MTEHDQPSSTEEQRESAAEVETLALRLTSRARAEQPPEQLGERVLEAIAERQRVQRLANPPRRLGRASLAVAAAIAVCAAIGLSLWPRGSSGPTLTAEPAARASTAPPTTPAPTRVDPCAQRTRATGRHPSIDDFEDGDEAPIPLEGRRGIWRWVRDNDGNAAGPRLLPTPRPEAQSGNRLALHVSGGRLRAWGASIELPFEPMCYDASAYDGVSISARGPGRVYLTARLIDVLPVTMGGTCERDCFNAHIRKIELGKRWKEYRVRFSEFEQVGYEGRPLDPSRLQELSVLVRAEDTPYDFWIDDIKFLERR